MRYEVRYVSLGRGKNSGRVLPHRNLVTGLRALGNWKDNAAVFDQPPFRDSKKRGAFLIRQSKDGRIIAVSRR